MEDSNLKLGSYLKSLRLSKGLSLKNLAVKLNIDFSLLSRIEAGDRSLSMDKVPVLAKALQADFKTLQTELLALSLLQEYGKEEFASEGIRKALKKMDNKIK